MEASLEPGAAAGFDRRVLAGPTLDAAGFLLGARLVRSGGSDVRIGRIVEIEAYVGEDDEACHARFGPTRRNAAMFGPPGHAYVYLVYGMYHCLNVVTEAEGRPAALLVRAVEPIAGGDLMRAARIADLSRRASAPPSGQARVEGLPTERLAAGPGLVCAAFSIGRDDNGADLCDPSAPLHLEPAPPTDRRAEIARGPRIGIGYAGEPWRSAPWRFWLADSPAVSGSRMTR